MTVRLRLRLALLARTAVAFAVLGSVALVAGAAFAGLGALLGAMAWDVARPVVGALDAAPLLSALLPVGPAAVAGAAATGLVVSVYGRATVARFVPGASARELDSVDPLWKLACLALFAVEGRAAVHTVAPDAGDSLFFFGALAAFTAWGTAHEARGRAGELAAALIGDSAPAERGHPEVAEAARRLAHQAGVPAPDVYVTETDRPESFAIGSGADASVAVSTGLLDALSRGQVEAVLAHEVSHLANADSRAMGVALTPVLMADDLRDEDPEGPFDYLWNAAFTLLTWYGQFGVAVLSKGREASADVAAAKLTGSPAALATALERLDDARQTPETDLREWEQTAAALDILPPEAESVGLGPFETHPPTEDRVARLRRLAARAERE